MMLNYAERDVDNAALVVGFYWPTAIVVFAPFEMVAGVGAVKGIAADPGAKMEGGIEGIIRGPTTIANAVHLIDMPTATAVFCATGEVHLAIIHGVLLPRNGECLERGGNSRRTALCRDKHASVTGH